MKRTLPLLLALGAAAVGVVALLQPPNAGEAWRTGLTADAARARYARCVERGDSVTCVDELKRDLGRVAGLQPFDGSHAAELLKVCVESGRDTVLRRLQRQIAELTKLLALEKGLAKKN
jgi:hypothetical protein